MQLMSGDKFKSFPVKLGNIIVPLSNIRYIKAYANSPKISSEIGTYSGDVLYSEIDVEAANAAWTKAFKDCEY